MIDDYDLIDWRDTDTDERAAKKAAISIGLIVLGCFIAAGAVAWNHFN